MSLDSDIGTFLKNGTVTASMEAELQSDGSEAAACLPCDGLSCEENAVVWCDECNLGFCAECDRKKHSTKDKQLSSHVRTPFESEIYCDVDENTLLDHLEATQSSLSICRGLFSEFRQPEPLELLSEADCIQFHEKGIVILDAVLDQLPLEALRERTLAYASQGNMKTPSLTRKDSVDVFRDESARGDVISWVHDEEALSTLPELLPVRDVFQKLSSDLNTLMRFSHNSQCNRSQDKAERCPSMELQLALYLSGRKGYERHRDAFPTGDAGPRNDGDVVQRKVTAILYVNPSWTPGDGGELRVETPVMSIGNSYPYIPCRPGVSQALSGDCFDIQPLGGRLVIFLSGVFFHQVLSSQADRVAVTAWFS
eukprot:Rmarinus@m.7995